MCMPHMAHFRETLSALNKKERKKQCFVKVIPKSHMTLRRISRIKTGNMISDMINEDRKPNSEL